MASPSTSTIHLTDNEKGLLKAILDSEFHDGRPQAERHGPDSAVWVNCLWGYEGRRLFGGTMASLAKKGLAQTDGECAWLTWGGLVMAMALAAEVR